MTRPSSRAAAVLDRAFLGLGALGVVASIAVHIAGYLGEPVMFGTTATLLVGAMLVWWRALGRARSTLEANGARELWTAVVARCSWLKYAFHLLVLYFAVHWARMLYMVGIEGDRTIRPGPWALFVSAGAGALYVISVGFLLAVRRAERSAEQR